MVDKYFGNPGNIEGMAFNFNRSLFSVWLSRHSVACHDFQRMLLKCHLKGNALNTLCDFY